MTRTVGGRSGGSDSMTLSSIRCAHALEALKPEWDALWQCLPQASYYQSAAYAIHSWRKLAEPSGYELFCVTGRENGKLVLIWPMKIRRKLLWRIGRPLSANMAEQTDLLTEDVPQANSRMAAALEFVSKTSGADILDLQLVPSHTCLAAQLQSRSSQDACRPDVIPFVRWAKGESWEDYVSDLSKTTRKVVEKKHRRLKGLGDLRFEIVSGAQDASETIASLLHYKRAWSTKVPDPSIWVHAPVFESFLTSMRTATETERAGMFLFVLKLDGALLAAQIAAVGHQVDWLSAAHNPDYHQLSPGIILNEYCLRWAHERRLNVLMGSGQQANKEFWCKKQGVRSASYRMPASLLGAATFQAMRLRNTLRSFDWTRLTGPSSAAPASVMFPPALPSAD